jgi:cytochrome oxidase Cu insertion factor (SCO1/SenC/PrrC family)
MGVFLLGMAALQALPGQGFWQGLTGAGSPGALVSMLQQMSQTPQPAFLAAWISSFAAFDESHPVPVNLGVIIALTAIGATFILARPRATRVALAAGLLLCLADWVLVQDLGFMGGVGTDPNSMVPMALVFVAGYVAMVRVPAPARDPVPATAPLPASPRSWRDRLTPPAALGLRPVLAAATAAVILVGAAPMAAATASSHADTIITDAQDGAPTVLDITAPGFTLVDQRGDTVSLASLRGRAIALTFLDPVCTSACPLIAQEFRETAGLLGPAAQSVEFVAVDANPRYTSPEYLAAFDRQEHLGAMSNWLYLTGSLPQLQQVWKSYGIAVSYAPGGAMIDHTLYAYVIDPAGHTRYLIGADPGAGTGATTSSFTATLAGLIQNTLSG